MHKLFKSALASQNSEVAKHKAAEEKAQQEVREENEISRGGRPTGHRESDSALFKQAFKDQSKDLAKAHAKALQVKDASERMTSSGTLLPRHHGLSDAKLFADASEKDLEASVLIVGGLAQRLPAADAAACVDALVQAALASTERGPARANALFSLYNMTTDLTARLAILNKILAYVRSAKLGTLVAPLARHVEDNYASWNLDPAATRAPKLATEAELNGEYVRIKDLLEAVGVL